MQHPFNSTSTFRQASVQEQTAIEATVSLRLSLCAEIVQHAKLSMLGMLTKSVEMGVCVLDTMPLQMQRVIDHTSV